MSQQQLNEKELQEILELCKAADQNMKDISAGMTAMVEKTQRWTITKQTTPSGKLN